MGLINGGLIIERRGGLNRGFTGEGGGGAGGGGGGGGGLKAE